MIDQQRHFKRCGFTLIELLIASSIFLVVMVTIISAFRTGIFGFRSIEQTLQAKQTATLVLDRLRLDLRNSLRFSSDESGFSGNNNSMSFLALVATFKNLEWQNEYAQVAYRFDDAKLSRVCRKGKTAMTQNNNVEPESTDLPLRDFLFSYGRFNSGENTDLVFSNEWAASKNFPSVVKVSFYLNDTFYEELIAIPKVN